jgi:hypothetical protein
MDRTEAPLMILMTHVASMMIVWQLGENLLFRVEDFTVIERCVVPPLRRCFMVIVNHLNADLPQP